MLVVIGNTWFNFYTVFSQDERQLLRCQAKINSHFFNLLLTKFIPIRRKKS